MMYYPRPDLEKLNCLTVEPGSGTDLKHYLYS